MTTKRTSRTAAKPVPSLHPHILVLHGPNLNLLGSREPKHYGRATLEDINRNLVERGRTAGAVVETFQHNHEGALVDRIQQAGRDHVDFIVINPAAYTHTSVALRDALAAIAIPFVEVHLSNIYARESFRHHSYFSDLAVGVVSGLGAQGYELALEYALRHLQDRTTPHGSQKTEKAH
ncbi:type II 3-dehydroquinate dehydratase [Betaproteobacteria bacterium SCN1]|jgi:3-dehydroquinate dehydratase-2|nr:type II 3-dehydroquinate dehydratase [Betaproteobacteria bacterium SCN1]MBN8760849.1 type II 3-dehydroquinate dehydratase [Thiobacillus sp.]ODU90655.1 MAG: type II 3-dehydroquinate dehydratase [Thiobacillus sp. SCN 65-179]OJW35916.1 MAG: type II 3-dehydroquinate dehydratase [Thiobacillus sp. 65-69]